MVILEGHPKGVGTVCISHDETLVASAVRDASEAMLWNLETERVERRLEGVRRIRELCFSGEGDVLRCSDVNGLWNHAWRVDDGLHAQNMPGEYEMTELCRGRPFDVRRFGSGEKQRLVLYGDGWRRAPEAFGLSRREVRRVGPGWVVGPHTDTGKDHTVVVRPMAPDDPLDPNAPPLDPLPADIGRAWSVALSDDRRHVALGFDNGLVYVHDYVANVEVGRWKWDLGRVKARLVKALAFSPDGNMLAAGSENRIAVWDLVPRTSPGAVERSLLEAITVDEPNAVAVHSDFLEEQGLKRWDRYPWRSTTPLRLHARAILRASAE